MQAKRIAHSAGAATPAHPNEAQPSRNKRAQPLHVAQLEDALLKLQTVRDMTGLSDSTIYRKLAARQFPEPVRLGARCTRWRAGDVTAWLRAQVTTAQERTHG